MIVVPIIISLATIGPTPGEVDLAEYASKVRPLVTIQYDGSYSRSTLGVSVRVLLDQRQDPILVRIVGFGEQGRTEEEIDLRRASVDCSFTIAGKSITYHKPVFHLEAGKQPEEEVTQVYKVTVEQGELASADGELPGPSKWSADEWVTASVMSAAHMLRETIPYSDDWRWIGEWIRCRGGAEVEGDADLE